MPRIPKLNFLSSLQGNASSGFSYYEYKYLVAHEYLPQIYQLLEALYGLSDPFSQGVVDSIYYDTIDQTLYEQCLNGDENKSKFRVRGYGDGSFGQVHEKMKALQGVGKYKSRIKAVNSPAQNAPDWDALQPAGKRDEFDLIMYHARKYGQLYPTIRVKYLRHRYRLFDYRITLDTNIEVFSPSNGLPHCLSYATLPYHVLEVKTAKRRPNLPFIGLIKLKQVSFSKFMLGLGMLNTSQGWEFSDD
jgi:hypothetical protein